MLALMEDTSAPFDLHKKNTVPGRAQYFGSSVLNYCRFRSFRHNIYGLQAFLSLFDFKGDLLSIAEALKPL